MPDGRETDETVERGEFTDSKHTSVSNAFCARGLELLAQMMAAGGRAQNASTFAAQAAALRKAMAEQMWNGTNYCDGVCSEVKGNSRVRQSPPHSHPPLQDDDDDDGDDAAPCGRACCGDGSP
jgi:hypothetical protein